MAAVSDVSAELAERRAGEEARRQLAAIVDGSGDAIFGTTTDGTITSWNGAAERLFGYSRRGDHRPADALIVPADRKAEQDRMRARLNAGGAHERLETTAAARTAALVEVLITASTADDEAGKVVGPVGDRPRHHRARAERSARSRRASAGWPRRSGSRTSAASSSTSPPAS